jgi:hypothetical protein
MGTLTRTTTIGDTCTRQDLYDLLAKATLNLAAGDLSSGIVAAGLTAASVAPAISEGVLFYDLTEQLLKLPMTKVGDSAASFYMAVGPDSWQFPGFNVADTIIPRGSLVRFSYSPAAGPYDITHMEPFPTNHTLTFSLGWAGMKSLKQLRNAYGIAEATIAPNEFGPVCTYGLAHALVDPSGSYQLTGDWLNKQSFGLCIHTAVTGMARVPAMNPHWLADMFGLLLTRPETTCVSFLAPVFVMFPLGQGSAPYPA